MNKNMIFWLLVILVMALLLVCWNAVLAADVPPVQSPAPTPVVPGPPPLPQPPAWDVAAELALPIVARSQ